MALASPILKSTLTQSVSSYAILPSYASCPCHNSLVPFGIIVLFSLFMCRYPSLAHARSRCAATTPTENEISIKASNIMNACLQAILLFCLGFYFYFYFSKPNLPRLLAWPLPPSMRSLLVVSMLSLNMRSACSAALVLPVPGRCPLEAVSAMSRS
jgi:hypothetical protein